jgi:hypothetical protein
MSGRVRVRDPRLALAALAVVVATLCVASWPGQASASSSPARPGVTARPGWSEGPLARGPVVGTGGSFAVRLQAVAVAATAKPSRTGQIVALVVVLIITAIAVYWMVTKDKGESGKDK